MTVLIVKIEGNICEGKSTLLQKFEQSLCSEDKVRMKVEHEPVKEFQSFYGNDLINPLEHFIRILLTMPLSSKIMYKMFINKEWKH